VIRRVLIFVLFIAGIFLGISPQQKLVQNSTSPSPSVKPQISELVPIVKVVDGDTIDVLLNGAKARVRLIGMDTPEIVDPRKPVQCFAKEASDKAKEILTGKSVRLESDQTQGDKDKYGRLLRYVFLEDGTLFNKFMIEQGYAHEYTYMSNPYKYQAEFKTAEKNAREQNLGLWSPSSCNGGV